MPRSKTAETTAAAPKPTSAIKKLKKHDFSKLDPSLFILSLFRPVQRGKREQRLVVEGEWGGERITVKSTDLLGADDLSILLACLSLAGQMSRGQKLRPGEVERHKDAIAALNPQGDAETCEHVIVDTSAHELLRIAGMSNGGFQYDQLAGILERLRGVHYIRETVEGNKRVRYSGAQEQLLYFHLKEDGTLRITLSERLSRALISNPYRSVYLPDYRLMRGDVARILLAGLSVRIRSGDTTRLSVDQMLPIVYGDLPEDEPNRSQKVRDRRRAVRGALEEIASLESWDIALDPRSMVSCTYLRMTTGRLIEPSNQQAMLV